MADLTDLQAAETVKIAGANPSTGIENNYATVDASGNLAVTVNNASGASAVNIQDGGNSITVDGSVTTTPGITDQGLVVRPLPYEPQSYCAAAVGFVPPAAATDIFTITGSATKIIRIHKIRVSGTTTSGSTIKVVYSLLRRSTANTGGTRVAVTAVKNDSNNAAATATVGNYTANPTLGTLVGAVCAISSGVSGSGLSDPEIIWDFSDDGCQEIILRGTSEQLSVNLNGATVTGPIFSCVVEWSEI